MCFHQLLDEASQKTVMPGSEEGEFKSSILRPLYPGGVCTRHDETVFCSVLCEVLVHNIPTIWIFSEVNNSLVSSKWTLLPPNSCLVASLK